MISSRIRHATDAMAPILRFMQTAGSRRSGDPDACDFVYGDPHDLPLPGLVGALERNVAPRDPSWFAYKMNEPDARETVAAALRRELDAPFEPEDVFLTTGGFAALAVALATLVEPGDEVIFVSPPWFFYEAMIRAFGGVPVRVRVDPETFDLDVAAIAGAIGERTRALIVNTPNNPTGRIYPPATLTALADALGAASARLGRPLWLLSDEAYRRIVFDGASVPSPTAFHPHALLLYTYGKTLLAPGQRIGYLALPPAMPERAALREALFTAQLTSGYLFPNALMQHALAELQELSIDVGALERRRDRLVAGLRDAGYELRVPEGTFYLLVRAPVEDDVAFTERLVERGVHVLPGSVVEMPGTFRISLTASDAMVERALPRFAAALAGAREAGSPG